MPGMFGFELQAKLKAHRCRIPIISSQRMGRQDADPSHA